MLVHKSGQAYLLELGYEPKVNSLMVSSHVDIPGVLASYASYVEVSPRTNDHENVFQGLETSRYTPLPLSDRCYNIRCQVLQFLRRCIEKILYFFINVFIFIQSKAV